MSSSFADAFGRAKDNKNRVKLLKNPTSKDAVEELKKYFSMDDALLKKLGFESADDGHDLEHLIVAGLPELMVSGMDLTSAFEKISNEKVDSLVWSKAEILVAIYDYVFFIENNDNIWMKPTLEQKIDVMKSAMSRIFEDVKQQYEKNPEIKFSKIDSVDRIIKEDIKNGDFRVPSEDEIRFHVNRARNIREKISKIKNIDALLEKKLSDFLPTEKELTLYSDNKVSTHRTI